jgi:hypothetical protein
MFTPIIYSPEKPFKEIHDTMSKGIEGEFELKFSKIRYGLCDIDIPIKSIPDLLIHEVLNPFYIF